MKKRKLFTALGVVAAGVALASCGEKEVNPLEGMEGTYDATIWVSEVDGVADLTAQQIDAFEEANPGIVINATIEGVSEAESATQMITDVETGADLFCFAQDQLSRLVTSGALNKLGVKASETVKKLNDGGAVKAASVNNNLYCYPLTSDNGYFMFYDKSVVSEDKLDDIHAILDACEAAGRKFSYELEGSGWYNAGFFFATGCHSEWVTDDSGKFLSVDDDFNSPNGLIAMKGIEKVVNHNAYHNSSNCADFKAAVPSAVVISGTWGSAIAKEALGENYGATDLPSFTVDGKSYHLGSYSGNKLLGVKPQVDAKRSAVFQQLALWLTNEKCQAERFDEFGWGPSNLAVQGSDAVKSDAALTALAKQSPYAIPQGQIHGSWWDISKVYATAAKNAENAADLEAALQAALDKYDADIAGLFNMSDDVKNAFTVIGSMGGDTWSKDIEMEKLSEGVWITKEAVTFVAGDEFKVRQGKSWDVAYGKDGNNFKVETAGSFYVKLVISGDAGTVTLEATKA